MRRASLMANRLVAASASPITCAAATGSRFPVSVSHAETRAAQRDAARELYLEFLGGTPRTT